MVATGDGIDTLDVVDNVLDASSAVREEDDGVTATVAASSLKHSLGARRFNRCCEPEEEVAKEEEEDCRNKPHNEPAFVVAAVLAVRNS